MPRRESQEVTNLEAMLVALVAAHGPIERGRLTRLSATQDSVVGQLLHGLVARQFIYDDDGVVVRLSPEGRAAFDARRRAGGSAPG